MVLWLRSGLAYSCLEPPEVESRTQAPVPRESNRAGLERESSTGDIHRLLLNDFRIKRYALLLDEFIWQTAAEGLDLIQAPADKTFRRGNGIQGILRCRRPGLVAHLGTIFQIAHHRGQKVSPRRVGKCICLTAADTGHEGIGGTKIDACGQSVLMWRLRLAYALGASPERLARQYP